jgi:hypothetical protein
MRLKDKLRRLEKAASKDAVLIHQRDGSVKVFDKMEVMGQLYLARLDAAFGQPRRSSDVLDALAGATPESRRAVEALDSGSWYHDLEPSEQPPEDLSE